MLYAIILMEALLLHVGLVMVGMDTFVLVKLVVSTYVWSLHDV